MRKRPQSPTQQLSLDSLVDIVSNNVGILIILAAFMALFSLIHPSTPVPENGKPSEPVPRKLLVPWSHPTNKHQIFLSVRHNRVQFFDLRDFFLDLAKRDPTGPAVPLKVHEHGVEIRFFPVTNQVYCLRFTPTPGQGENWLQAQQPQSTWRKVLQRYPPERYVYFFWVTGDSFELFRQIRSDLWHHQYEVGWRPTGKDQPMEVCNGFEGSTTFEPQ